MNAFHFVEIVSNEMSSSWIALIVLFFESLGDIRVVESTDFVRGGFEWRMKIWGNSRVGR